MVAGRYYTMGQTSRLTGIKPHVLRYWEKEFRWLAPRKNSAGRRIYSEHDLELIRLIDRLIHKEGYSVAGARKRIAALLALSDQVSSHLLERIKAEIREVRDMLEGK